MNKNNIFKQLLNFLSPLIFLFTTILYADTSPLQNLAIDIDNTSRADVQLLSGELNISIEDINASFDTNESLFVQKLDDGVGVMITHLNSKTQQLTTLLQEGSKSVYLKGNIPSFPIDDIVDLNASDTDANTLLDSFQKKDNSFYILHYTQGDDNLSNWIDMQAMKKREKFLQTNNNCPDQETLTQGELELSACNTQTQVALVLWDEDNCQAGWASFQGGIGVCDREVDSPTDFSQLTTYSAGPTIGLKGTITDADGISEVEIVYKDAAGSIIHTSNYADGNINLEGTFDVGTSYIITVTDALGNVSTFAGTLKATSGGGGKT